MKKPLEIGMCLVFSVLVCTQTILADEQIKGSHDPGWVPPSATLPVFFATDRERAKDNKGSVYSNKRQFHSQCDYGVCSVSMSWDKTSPPLEGPLWLMGWRGSNESIGKSKNGEPPLARAGNCQITNDKNQFFNQLRTAIELSPNKQLVVFTHGYNNSFESAVETAAELEYYFQSPVLAFCWPSQHQTDKYTFDECNVEWGLRDYRMLLHDVEASEHGIDPSRVIVVGHSMGNRLVMWALTARADKAAATDEKAEPVHFKAVVMSSPDVDAGTMTKWAWLIKRNADHKWLLVSHRDMPLRLSRGVHGNQRLGGIGSLPLVKDVDLAWDHPAVPYGFETVDFTAIDTGALGHSIPYKLIDLLIEHDNPQPDYCWTDRKEGKTHWHVINK